MYNYNTVDGKLDRINHLKDLISKMGESMSPMICILVSCQ